MKIAVIGSSQYMGRMRNYKMLREVNGKNEVRLPLLDGDATTELELVKGNLKNIWWCDQVHLFWDGRSPGTLLEIGMTIALEKPLFIKHLEEKSLTNLMKQYAAESHDTTYKT